MTKYLLLVLLTTLSSISIIKAQPIRGLYVDGFNQILGNPEKEDSLLNYAQQNGFNYLTLYNLWPIHVTYDLTNVSTSVVLANFIENAKQNYGVIQVGATGENFFFFNNVIKPYNTQHTNPLQKFDVYNVEFEFWNEETITPGNYYCTTYLDPEGYTCDNAGAFSFFEKLIHQVDSLTNIEGIISETYVGWFTQDQAITIGNTVDRILLHDYISNYSWIYSYIDSRLEYIAARNEVTDVIPIFSAEPNFMGPWLSTNDVITPYNDIQTFLLNETDSWKQYINILGYQWFAYSFMPYTVSSGASITELDLNNNTNVFPNPFSFETTLKTDYAFEKASLHIYNQFGQEVMYINNISGNNIIINRGNLSEGFYLIKVKEGNKITATAKILISDN